MTIPFKIKIGRDAHKRSAMGSVVICDFGNCPRCLSVVLGADKFCRSALCARDKEFAANNHMRNLCVTTACYVFYGTSLQPGGSGTVPRKNCKHRYRRRRHACAGIPALDQPLWQKRKRIQRHGPEIICRALEPFPVPSDKSKARDLHYFVRRRLLCRGDTIWHTRVSTVWVSG